MRVGRDGGGLGLLPRTPVRSWFAPRRFLSLVACDGARHFVDAQAVDRLGQGEACILERLLGAAYRFAALRAFRKSASF